MLRFEGKGRVVKDFDVETIKTKAGKEIAKAVVVVAFNNGTEKATGEDKPSTFLQVELWDKLATRAENFATKGSLVDIKGGVLPNNYEKDGKTIYGFKYVANDINVYATKTTDNTKSPQSKEDMPF